MASIIGRCPPWLVCQSPQGVYYSNESTGETTWQPPPEIAAQMAQAQPPAHAAQAQQAAQYQAMAAQAAQYQAYQQAMAYQQQMAAAQAAQAAQHHAYTQQQGATSRLAPSVSGGSRLRGYLKKWTEEKGFGFIDGGANGQGDIFFHFSGLTSAGNKEDLREGVSLEYEMGVDGRTGKSRAMNVVILG
eukprot:TRINITY_DN94406_c0_g1_i1.p1 TRINITY_DN94406_c0_g1~~TRINITY_DN94406_c0_g1_i1.p1  ORF type:complete len:188 (+),score=34.20 TRINITY_DN94406_c0_g1_i1:105-668(+)